MLPLFFWYFIFAVDEGGEKGGGEGAREDAILDIW